MIISPGEGANLGTPTFPDTQKIPGNRQMHELTVVGPWWMLSLPSHLVSNTCSLNQPRGLLVPPVACNGLVEKEPCR